MAGTPIAAKDGLKAIETVKKGDEVWAYDFVSKQWKLEKVNEPLVHDFDGSLVQIQVGDEKITSTDNHPYWVESGVELEKRPAAEDVKGADSSVAASATGRWISARDLRTGDTLVLKGDQKVKIGLILIRKDKVKVYNMNVGSLHTYAVGKTGVLVHNKAAPSTSTGSSSSSSSSSSSGNILLAAPVCNEVTGWCTCGDGTTVPGSGIGECFGDTGHTFVIACACAIAI